MSYLKWKVNIKKMYDKLWKSTLDLVPDWQLKFPKIEEKTLHFYAPFDASLKEQVCSKRNKTRPSVQINDYWVKGQLISKANCQAVNSSKKWIRFLEEIEVNKVHFEINWPLGLTKKCFNCFSRKSKLKFFLHLLFGWFNELQKYVYTTSYVVMAESTHINGRGKKSKVG